MKFKILETFTIEKLIELHEQKKLNLTPPYQRNDIWSTSEKKELIDSIYKGYPIQNFYFQEKPENKYDVVDGQQRCRAIFGYYDGIFEYNGKVYSKKEDKEFRNYLIAVIVVTTENKNDAIEEFYARINRTGKKINKPELRKAQYYDTNFLKLIYEAVNLKDFEELDLFSETSINRMNDIDLVTELFSQMIKGITEKKIEIENIFENDITKGEIDKYLERFKQVIKHFTSFNSITPINETRYKQRNDLYTLFGFVNNNLDLKNEAMGYIYKILVIIGKYISPSNEDSKSLYNYALNCVSQSNSKEAREERLKFMNDLFLNSDKTLNSTQEEIIKLFHLKKSDTKLIQDKYLTISLEALQKKDWI